MNIINVVKFINPKYKVKMFHDELATHDAINNSKKNQNRFSERLKQIFAFLVTLRNVVKR
ncbi:hypothetical protein T11_5477 [Trichinella zimbabwensis]|uniref:Uncharacterized protein n=1 Tax=Trichinella zimbabwensis TaxID=268475 RepID=A0A0V1HF72_9BILA|nr:hypothetical protein T11_5477 [Trichinella zimbabwensis]